MLQINTYIYSILAQLTHHIITLTYINLVNYQCFIDKSCVTRVYYVMTLLIKSFIIYSYGFQ